MISLATAQRWYDRVDISGPLQKKYLSEATLLQHAFSREVSHALMPQAGPWQRIVSNAYASGSLCLGVGRVLSPALTLASIAMGKPPVLAAEWIFGRGNISQPTYFLRAPTSDGPRALAHMLSQYDRITASGALGVVLEVAPMQAAQALAQSGHCHLATTCVLGATLGRCALQPFRLAITIVGVVMAISVMATNTAVRVLLEVVLRTLYGVVGLVHPEGSAARALRGAADGFSRPMAELVPWPTRLAPAPDAAASPSDPPPHSLPPHPRFDFGFHSPVRRAFVGPNSMWLEHLEGAPATFDPSRGDVLVPSPRGRGQRHGNVTIRAPLVQPSLAPALRLRAAPNDVRRSEAMPPTEARTRPTRRLFSDALAQPTIAHPHGPESHKEVRTVLATAFARFQVKDFFRSDMVSDAEAIVIADGIVEDLRVFCRHCPDDTALRGGVSQLAAFMELSYETALWQPPQESWVPREPNRASAH